MVFITATGKQTRTLPMPDVCCYPQHYNHDFHTVPFFGKDSCSEVTCPSPTHTPFRKYLKLYLLCVCIYMCHSMQMEVRGQCWLDSFLKVLGLAHFKAILTFTLLQELGMSLLEDLLTTNHSQSFSDMHHIFWKFFSFLWLPVNIEIAQEFFLISCAILDLFKVDTE